MGMLVIVKDWGVFQDNNWQMFAKSRCGKLLETYPESLTPVIAVLTQGVEYLPNQDI
jgi:hypothetical protein